MVRICGACTALLAFSVTILRGLSVNNPTETILTRAICSLVIFLVIGSAVGWIGQTVVDDYNRRVDEKESLAAAEAADDLGFGADSDAGPEEVATAEGAEVATE